MQYFINLFVTVNM
jgi:hypothetical protein